MKLMIRATPLFLLLGVPLGSSSLFAACSKPVTSKPVTQAAPTVKRPRAEPPRKKQTRPHAQKQQLALAVHWGTGKKQLKRVVGNEGADEVPNSFTVDAKGRLYVLDSVGNRVQMYKGRHLRTLSLRPGVYSHVATDGLSLVGVLDTHRRKSLSIVEFSGKLRREIPLPRRPSRHKGQISGLLYQNGGFYFRFSTHTPLGRLPLLSRIAQGAFMHARKALWYSPTAKLVLTATRPRYRAVIDLRVVAANKRCPGLGAASGGLCFRRQVQLPRRADLVQLAVASSGRIQALFGYSRRAQMGKRASHQRYWLVVQIDAQGRERRYHVKAAKITGSTIPDKTAHLHSDGSLYQVGITDKRYEVWRHLPPP